MRGQTYVAARHPLRRQDYRDTPDPVRWRLIAGEDDTGVTLDPPHPELGASVELATPGHFVELVSDDHFVAKANHLFMLVQYMVGPSDFIIPEPVAQTAIGGGPSMAQAVPLAPWTEDIWTVTNFLLRQETLVITRSPGTPVQVSCLGEVNENAFAAVGDGSYEVAYVDDVGGEGECIDGPQHITASDPITVSLFGLDTEKAYAFPAAFGDLAPNAP